MFKRRDEDPTPRHPSANYIKYLIVTKQNVHKLLKQHELPRVEEETLKELIAELEFPDKFDCSNKFHKESMDFLKSHFIYSLCFPDKFTTEAFSYLEDMDVKTHIQEFLLGKTSPLDTARNVNTKLNLLITEEGVDRFRHYFWNVKNMRVEDWSRVLTDPQERHKANRLIRGGTAYAKWRLGGFHTKIEAKQLLADTLGTIKYDLEEIKHAPASSEKTKMISSMVTTIVEIDDRLSTMDITMKETLKQFEKFRMLHIKSSAVPIHESAIVGNFSGSGMLPTEIPKDELRLLDAKRENLILEIEEENEDV